ncbi:MAG TPA: CehA/McbA family metallohydrolase [Pyrinomonadaceae bacterium]|nr:CehA/McbA family metallohydrolase [Pyrinomonadaceae bacterium]
MKRKILIVILGLVVLSQMPFAYRRYRLHRLKNTIQQLAPQRLPASTESDYADYKGVIHVHSFLGGHSTGNFSELITGAQANQLDFVIMTEHPQAEFDTSAMTLSGMQAGILFVNGNEVSTASGDRLLLIPGQPNAASMSSQTTQQVIDQQKNAGGLAIVAYPSESQNWQSTNVDGVEIYNLFTNARQINRFVTFFDGLWSYRGYADLMFANFFTRPGENIQRWNAAISNNNHRLVAVAGNDAHSNIGVSLNDATGRQLIGLKLDPYERSFRTVRTHVLIKRDKGLTRESLLDAVSQGHCYLSFDLFSDARGFDFRIKNSDKIMGDETALTSQPRLEVQSPLPARIVMLKNGDVIDQKSGTTADFSPDGPGVYRVELYLDSLPAPVTGQPWVISNPIYVK